MANYPDMIVPVDHVEPVPRRVRAVLAGEVIVDTLGALYVWEWPPYPQFYLPVADFVPGVLQDEGSQEQLSRGTARRHGLVAGDTRRAGAAQVFGDDAIEGLAGTVRLEWDALDAWFEEDEEVFVHPRNPFARVDAVRSTRPVRIELDGAVIADSQAPVMVFETGLPPRYYVDPSTVDFNHLVPSTTVTACPYKGRTSSYWSIRVGDRTHEDLAWSYAFPTREMLAIAGLIGFFNERVDVFVDGELQERPSTPFFEE